MSLFLCYWSWQFTQFPKFNLTYFSFEPCTEELVRNRYIFLNARTPSINHQKPTTTSRNKYNNAAPLERKASWPGCHLCPSPEVSPSGRQAKREVPERVGRTAARGLRRIPQQQGKAVQKRKLSNAIFFVSVTLPAVKSYCAKQYALSQWRDCPKISLAQGLLLAV